MVLLLCPSAFYNFLLNQQSPKLGQSDEKERKPKLLTLLLQPRLKSDANADNVLNK
jgi:hypothetical protein